MRSFRCHRKQARDRSASARRIAIIRKAASNWIASSGATGRLETVIENTGDEDEHKPWQQGHGIGMS